MGPQGRFVMLNPMLSAPKERAKLAPRLDTLDGKVVGLLSNGFAHATEMLDETEKILREKYELGGIIRYTKSYIGEPADPRVLEELVASCDAVITSIGA